MGTILAYQNILYNMFITTFGIRRPLMAENAYVFFHSSTCALKKQQSVSVEVGTFKYHSAPKQTEPLPYF